MSHVPEGVGWLGASSLFELRPAPGVAPCSDVRSTRRGKGKDQPGQRSAKLPSSPPVELVEHPSVCIFFYDVPPWRRG